MSCERCGFTHYKHVLPGGETRLRLGETRWCHVDGQRTRVCLGCVAELRQEGHKVLVR